LYDKDFAKMLTAAAPAVAVPEQLQHQQDSNSSGEIK